MISPFTRSGTEVVCVDGNFDAPVEQLETGGIYTVRGMTRARRANGNIGSSVFLCEVCNGPSNKSGIEWSYNANRFRYLDLAGLDAMLTEKHDAPLPEAPAMTGERQT
jgi:hypothetical protein